jgi:hypothetical protein
METPAPGRHLTQAEATEPKGTARRVDTAEPPTEVKGGQAMVRAGGATAVDAPKCTAGMVARVGGESRLLWSRRRWANRA